MRRLIFLLLENAGLPWLLRNLRVRGREMSILTFHRVGGAYDPQWPPMPVDVFRKLMQALSQEACIIPLERIGTIEDYPDKPLMALSFDDGYADFLINAVPILTELGLPAHLNICPSVVDEQIPPWTQVVGTFMRRNSGKVIQLPNGNEVSISNQPTEADLISVARQLSSIEDEERDRWIDKLAVDLPTHSLPPLLNWDEIRQCNALGFHIGSHGMKHRNLGRADEVVLVQEIKESRERIRREVGVAPAIFAFPNGWHTHDGIRIAKECGYTIVLLCEDQVVTHWQTSPKTTKNFHVFPRININGSNRSEEHLRIWGFHQRVQCAAKGISHRYLPVKR